MQLTGHHKWGFLVYRTIYSDSSQARFDAYVTALRSHITFALEINRFVDILADSFELTVIEDRDRLEGASKGDIQKIFREWVTSCSVARDGPGVDFGDTEGKKLKALLPRYRMCLYVDQECLRSIEVAGVNGRNKRTSHRGVVIDVDEEREDRCWMWLALVTTAGEVFNS